MTAKEYLLQYSELKTEIESLRKNIYNLDSLEFETKSEDVRKLRNEVSDKCRMLYEKYHEIEDSINSVEKTELRNILYKKYINGQTWENIAVEMNISYRHVLRLHGAALQEIKRIKKMS